MQRRLAPVPPVYLNESSPDVNDAYVFALFWFVQNGLFTSPGTPKVEVNSSSRRFGEQGGASMPVTCPNAILHPGRGRGFGQSAVVFVVGAVVESPDTPVSMKDFQTQLPMSPVVLGVP